MYNAKSAIRIAEVTDSSTLAANCNTPVSPGDQDVLLLQKAAVVAGVIAVYDGDKPTSWKIVHADGIARAWKPLNDDGDAFRMAVMRGQKEGFCVSAGSVEFAVTDKDTSQYYWRIITEPEQTEAATRRAIVRAFADIFDIEVGQAS